MLEYGTILETIKDIVSAVLEMDVDEIGDDSKLINELGLDSIDLLTMVSKISKEFSVSYSIANTMQRISERIEQTDSLDHQGIIAILESELHAKFKEQQMSFIEIAIQENLPGEQIAAELLTPQMIANQIHNLVQTGDE